MTKDDILRIANETYGIGPEDKQLHPSALLHLERFAELVAKHEREACAAICDHYDEWGAIPRQAAAAIRARRNDDHQDQTL